MSSNTFACPCGRMHATWWRTVQATSCGLPRYVIHGGTVYTERQWSMLRPYLEATQ